MRRLTRHRGRFRQRSHSATRHALEKSRGGRRPGDCGRCVQHRRQLHKRRVPRACCQRRAGKRSVIRRRYMPLFLVLHGKHPREGRDPIIVVVNVTPPSALSPCSHAETLR
ncbi:hypothetical protein MGWOODY_Smn3017 [hydrothermal vent metagenome]|uniref:Uncharacterized protein n=1 Tax=hydrothermal vent metagenome TaxID=652676 RepID=A0A160TJW9_9ZZZZ